MPPQPAHRFQEREPAVTGGGWELLPGFTMVCFSPILQYCEATAAKCERSRSASKEGAPRLAELEGGGMFSQKQERGGGG